MAVPVKEIVVPADASAQNNIRTVEPIANALTVRIHTKMGSANGTVQIFM